MVDGCVQVFAQTGSPSKAPDAYDDEDDNGYQLLNNVQSGGTLSSLFTILSLFTEDVKLRYDETPDRPGPSRTRSDSFGGERDSDVTDFTLDDLAREQAQRRAGGSAYTTPTKASRPSAQPHTVRPSARTSGSPGPPLARAPSTASFVSSSTARTSSDGTATETEHGSPRVSARPLDPITSAPGTPGFGGLGPGGFDDRERRSRTHSYVEPAKEGTIARATVDTTLAVIPAEAFRRLTKKFPNAAA